MTGHGLFKLFLILNALYGRQAIADDLLPKCQHALSACANYVGEQANEIKHLKEALKDTQDLAAKASQGPLVPWYGWLGLGVAAGVAGAVLIRR